MSNGLEDVIAADTVLSEVDGLGGRLVLRGMELHELAGRWRYEEVLHLLWSGFFPDLPDAPELGRRLGAARTAAFAKVDHLETTLPPYDALRAFLAGFGDGTDLDTALALVAGAGVALPALARAGIGQEPVAPDPSAHHAADMLRMLTGNSPASSRTAALDTYLVTVADHGLNASTFTARVVASTEAGLMSSVVAAMGALKGPLHGGAPGPVLDMLDAIGTADRAEGWIAAELAAGRRLMGFGHRIYRVRDPRADALGAALSKVSTGADDRLAFARTVEQVAIAALKRHKPDRPLETNVEFYTALLLDALGFPRDTFTLVFAAARIGGWIAHAGEQAATGRLIRPKSRYVGPSPLAAA